MESFDYCKNENLRKIANIFNYIKPSQIQQEVLNQIHERNNLIIISQAGTGKTFSYYLYLFSRFNFDIKSLQALIILPTRELAVQTSQYLEIVNNSRQFE